MTSHLSTVESRITDASPPVRALVGASTLVTAPLAACLSTYLLLHTAEIVLRAGFALVESTVGHLELVHAVEHVWYQWLPDPYLVFGMPIAVCVVSLVIVGTFCTVDRAMRLV